MELCYRVLRQKIFLGLEFRGIVHIEVFVENKARETYVLNTAPPHSSPPKLFVAFYTLTLTRILLLSYSLNS